MIAVLQRVREASVTIEGKVHSSIGLGFLILLGVAPEDSDKDAELLAAKIGKLRIFEDENGKMNLSASDVSGEALVVSNFTLLAHYEHGNRPDFFGAASPDVADPLYEKFKVYLSAYIPNVQSGIFGADMKVSLVNDGPITMVLDSMKLRK